MYEKKKGFSRTMNWLNLSAEIQKKFARETLSVSCDYLQYTCYDIAEPLRNLYSLWFSGEIDIDNSNIEYNHEYNLALQHNETKMWHAYMLTFLSPGFAPLPIASIEVYNPNRVRTLGTQGKIVFYGAYFVFRDIIAEEAPWVLSFANGIELGTIVRTQKNDKPIYKRTRVDVAVDVSSPVDQDWLKYYIKPSKNSKSVPKPYNYQPELWGWQSIGYIPRLGQCIGIRIYNKILDIQAKNKQAWYPEYWTEETPIVTRIEVVYSGDSALESIEGLIAYTKYRILWDEEVRIKRTKRPQSVYSPRAAYTYMSRYSKNHGQPLNKVLADVVKIWENEEKCTFIF